MLAAIYDLTTARPHMRKSVHFTPEQIRSYHEGYYWGVVMALRVAEHASAEPKPARAELRAVPKRKKSA